jgi:hypothetical protein
MDVSTAKEIVLEYLSSKNISDKRIAEDNDILSAITQNPNDSLTLIKEIYENTIRIGKGSSEAYDNAYSIIKAILVPVKEQREELIKTSPTKPVVRVQTYKPPSEKEVKTPSAKPFAFKFNPLYLFLPLLTLIGIIFALKFGKR